MPVDHKKYGDDGYVDEASAGVSSEPGIPFPDRKIGMVVPSADHEILDTGNPKKVNVRLVCGRKGPGQLLGHSIVMMMREDRAGCAPNQCLSRLIGDVASSVRGFILLLRQTKAANPTSTFDIHSSDFTLTIDGLIDYARTINKSKSLAVADYRKKLLIVKISQSPLRFEHVQVPTRHPVFKTGKLYGVTDLLKSPIRMFKYPVGTAAAIDDDPGHKHHTMSLSAFCLTVDPHSPNFAKTPATYTDHGGPVLLVCADGRELSHCKLNNMCELIRDSIQPTLLKVPEDRREEFVDELKKKWGAIFGVLNAAGPKPCGLSPWR